MKWSLWSLAWVAFTVAEKKEDLKCFRPAVCEALPANATCFGTPIPYGQTRYNGFDPAAAGSSHYWDVQAKLEAWTALKFVPKCWPVIRPLLCSLYLPECRNDSIRLIQKQLCQVVKNQCRIVNIAKRLPVHSGM